MPQRVDNHANLSGRVIVDISLGFFHSCAIVNTASVRTAWCWGRNEVGQLGRGTFDNNNNTANRDPTQVVNITDVDALSAGENHACAFTSGGISGWCWGQAGNSQLGSSTATEACYLSSTCNTAPVAVVDN